MKFSAFTTRILRKKILQSINSEQVFQRILERERGRSERNGGSFSLLDIAVSTPIYDPVLLTLIHALKDRIRSTDALGWLSEDHIGVIMPDTSFEGAAEFGRDIKNNLLPTNSFFDFNIYTYPENSPSLVHNKLHTASSDKLPEPNILSRFTCKPIPLWKRSLDIIGATLALILLCPVFLIVAIFIKSVSPGPVFFKQERIGYTCKPFMCWKFRTMTCDTDPEKHKAHVCRLIQNKESWQKLDDQPDSGVIPFGNILRKSCLDELPQLFNVIRGEMSLIGPRPCIAYEAKQFCLWQQRRFDTHPGLTGLWQVSGKNRTTFEEMMRLDIHYGQKRSFIRDTIIFFKTFPAILNQITEKVDAKRISDEKSSN